MFDHRTFFSGKYIKTGCRFIGLGLLLFCTLVSHASYPEIYDGDEELSVNLNVKGIGSSEIPALYRNTEIFLSVTDLFNFLKIKNQFTETLDSVTGFLIDEKATFLIDKQSNKIIYQQKEYQLESGDLVSNEGKLYLKGNYFGKIFGLVCVFDFRNLSVNLNTDLELPVIREMRQELMRANVNKLKGEEPADTSIGRQYPFANFGMADWSLINVHSLNDDSDIRASIGLGGILAGGETNIALNYDSRNELTPRQQYYLWRYVNNDNKFIRQSMAGKIQPQFISSVYAPAIGVQLTNSATVFRRSFGTYTLSNTTYPGWIVELYVNNVLISYVKADASGFYTFQVPLVYGNSAIKLRLYGPYGEERAIEEFVNIPFNFMPAKQFEYNVSAGILEDGFHTYTATTSLNDSIIETRVKGKANTRFSKARFSYGISRFITVGGGVEYLSSVESGKVQPFVNTAVRIAPSLMFTAEYLDKVVSKGVLTYRMPSDLQFELNYSLYDKEQTAIKHSYIEQRKLIISYPFSTRFFSAYSRLSLDQFILENTNYLTAEWLLSGAVKGVSTNLSTYSLFIDKVNPLIYSNLSLGFRLPRKFVLTPQVQYEYTQSKVISIKCTLEKKIKKFGLINTFYEENLHSHFRFAGIGLRMDLTFAQVGIQTVKSAYSTSFTEHANGSFIINKKQKSVMLSNRSSVGRGGLVIAPFLDLNNNGRKDYGEPKASGLKMDINGGNIVNNIRDSVIQVYDLEPFTSYYIRFHEGSFDNINWSLKKKSMNVLVDPNNLKLIEIPVTVAAEVSGMVYLGKKSSSGQGKIVVIILDKDDQVVARVMTEYDGYFSFLGLSPGSYSARIDPLQLEKLNLRAEPFSAPFYVEQSREGDLITGLEFILKTVSEPE